MRTKNLSTLTCHVVASYGNTAKHAITAYRTGGERVVGVIEQRWNRSLNASRSQLAEGVARNANAVQARLQQFAQSGLALTSNGAESLVNKMVQLADAGVHSVADNALWLEAKVGTTALTRLSELALPAANAWSRLADQVEDQSAKLVGKIAGKPVRRAAPKRARVAVRKAIKTATATV